MRIVKEARGIHDTHMVLEANIGGDYLPETITIHHNGREIVYTR